MKRAGLSTWRFLLNTLPTGGLEIWGLPGIVDFEQELSSDSIAESFLKRELLHFQFPNSSQGLEDFFSNKFRNYLHWHETPYCFLTCDESLKDHAFGELKVIYIPAQSAPKEFRFLARIQKALALKTPPSHPQLLKEKLLLHVCCGPDAAGVVKQLKEDFDLRCFWYDPNIQPREEHDKRLDAFEKVMRIYDLPYSVGPYDVENFESKIEGLQWSSEKGAKCSLCYDMRLEKSAELAQQLGYKTYATTLAISPHKVQQKLLHFGDLNYKKYGVRYYHQQFMKLDGFNDSVEFTREHSIYRQDYCGCFYSLHEGGAEAQAKAKAWGFLPD